MFWGRSVNASGDVTGRFSDGNQGEQTRRFVRDRNGTFTLFDADPAAIQTFPASINASGDVTGSFLDGTLNRTRGCVRSPN